MFKFAKNFFSIITYDYNEHTSDKICIKFIVVRGVLEQIVRQKSAFRIPMYSNYLLSSYLYWVSLYKS